MPLSTEVLEHMKETIADAEASIKDLDEIIADLRKSAIDASKQEEALREAKDSLAKLRAFYDRQSSRSAD